MNKTHVDMITFNDDIFYLASKGERINHYRDIFLTAEAYFSDIPVYTRLCQHATSLC